MGNNKISISSVTATAVMVQFEQLVLDDSISAYYSYVAQHTELSTNFTIVNNNKLVHNKSSYLVLMFITGLKSETDYAIRIVPYREISHSDFSNQGREAGVPSKEMTFTTSR